MSWLLIDWKPYALRMGLHLLKGDIDHARLHLSRVRKDRQKALMKEYVRIWLEEGGEPLNQNKGRFAANQFMLNL